MSKEPMTSININVPVTIEEDANVIFNDLGINMSTAVNMFLKKVIAEQGIPFEVKKHPSKALLESLKELDDFENGKIELKGFHDVDDFIEDALK